MQADKAKGAKPKEARPKEAKPKEAILATAAKLFSEYGYAGTTMREIGNAVGVLPGSLYAHIESKETLLYDVVEFGIKKFLELESRINGSAGSPEEQLRTAIKFHVGVVAENPQYTQVVFHQWRFLSGTNRKRVVTMRGRYGDLFRKIFDRGMADGSFNPKLDTRLEVLTLLGALNWIPEWYSTKGEYSAGEIGEKIADTLFYGLRKRV